MGLLDAMHEGVLAGVHPRPPRETAETSFIYRIFAGRLRSQARLERLCPPCCCSMRQISYSACVRAACILDVSLSFLASRQAVCAVIRIASNDLSAA